MQESTQPSPSELIAAVAWECVQADLRQTGYARLGPLLSREQCESERALYSQSKLFRSRINMERFRFGRGEYQYFAYPLPPLVTELRHALYPRLFGLANEWMKSLGITADYPPNLDAFLKRCHAHGQKRPTPLLLRYVAGDYNCLHQDVYGEIVFPFQVVFGLSRRDEEFTGGELLLVEQRPRAQSVGHAIRLQQGEAVVITTRYRPAHGARGFSRTKLKHGVSPILSGERFTLGIIFHDAE